MRIEFSKEQLVSIAEQHIRRYEGLLNGESNFTIRPIEVQTYLSIWVACLDAINNNQPISEAACQELEEFFASGDFTAVLPKQLKPIE